MIVKPRIVKKKIKENEIRVINVDYQAVLELLSEVLIENTTRWFHIPLVGENEVLTTFLDLNSGVLTYTAMPFQYALGGKKLDAEYLRQEIGLTCDSLYTGKQRYRSLEISDDMFLKD